jgi:hypothetical protein
MDVDWEGQNQTEIELKDALGQKSPDEQSSAGIYLIE